VCSEAVAAALVPALEDFPDIAAAVRLDPQERHERAELDAFDLVVVVVETELTPSIRVALGFQSLVIARPGRLPSTMNGAALDEINGALQGREVSTYEKATDVSIAVRRSLEARRVGVPTTVELGVETPLGKRRAEAQHFFATGRVQKAVAAYEGVIAEAEQRNLKSDLQAARLGLALSFLALERLDDARAVARALEVEHVAKAAHLTVVRLLTALELSAEATPFIAALSDDAELEAFNTMLSNSVPEAVPQTPDLVMQAVALLTQEHRFATAADWLRTCFDKVRGNVLLSVFYIERVAVLLEEWCWNVPGDNPVDASSLTQLLNDAAALSAAIELEGLAASIATRLVRAELGIASRTYDDPRVNELGAKLAELAGPPPDDVFVVALRTALRGEVDEAMALLSSVQPEWRGRMQQLSVGFEAGRVAESTKALQALAVEYPDVPIVQAELTRRLVDQNRVLDALPAARQSYRLLPGIGQLLYLAHALIVSGASDEAAALLREVPSPDARIAGLLAQAIESNQLLEALSLWATYLDAYPLDWRSQLRLINLMARANRFDMARERAWTIVEKNPLLAPPGLFFEAAVLQDAFGTDPERTTRIKWLWEALDRRPADDTDVNRVRMLIWLHLSERVPLPKPDFALAEGAVISVESAQGAEILETAHRQAKLVRHLYEEGHISVLCAFPAISDDPASYVFSLGKTSYLPAGEPTLAEPPTLGTHGCVRLGVLEILAIARLDLLGDMEARLAAGLRVHVFDDVIDALSRIVLTRALAHSDVTRDEAKRLLMVATSGSFVEAEASETETWLDSASDRVALLQELKRRGAISSRTYERLAKEQAVDAREPPPLSNDAVGVTMPTLRWLLDNQLIDVASTVERRLLVRRNEIAELRAAIVQADEGMQVQQLAERAYRWLAERIAAKSVVSEPRRAPRLGVLRPVAHESMQNSVIQAASELEAVVGAECISVQLDPFVRDLFSRTFIPQSLRTLQDHSALTTAQARYEPARRRMQSFAWFVSQLAPERSAELLEELLTWGDAAAFTGHSLRQLVLEYPSLQGRAATILEKTERAAVDVSHARHFSAAMLLARAHGEFFVLSLDGDSKAEIGVRWRPLLDRMHRLSAPQKLWLLDFVLTAMVGGAETGFESKDGVTYTLSSDTPLGAAADEVLAWCAQEPLDLLAHVISEIVVSMDKLAADGPGVVRLAPLILFLRAASPDGLSLTHPRIEPIAILSAFWESKPLEKLDVTFGFSVENGPVETVKVLLEQVMADAVQATREKRAGITFSTSAMHFKYSLREGVAIEAEVPTIAVLMRLDASSRRVLARELSGHIGASDGVIYQLLQRVIDTPDDMGLLRDLARRAVLSPMRQIRVVPGLAAFLPDLLLKLRTPDTGNQLRSLLSEASTTGDAVARFDENVPSWITRDDALGLVTSTALVPGGLGWTWAVSCVELDRGEDLKRAEYFMMHPEVAHFGELWWAIATTWLAAACGSEDQRASFEQNLEAVLASVIATPRRGQHEADSIAALREVVRKCETDASAVVWMTYRLYGWWFLQLRNSHGTIDDGLRDLASSGVGQRASGSDDAADPQSWPSGYDVRLVAVLSAISECSARVELWLKAKSLPEWKLTLGDSSRKALAAIAERNIEPEVVSSPSMAWLPPLRPAMTALAALWMNGGRFIDLQQTARERWISWLPLVEADDRTRPRAFVQQVLWFATKDLDDLSPLEAALLIDRIAKSTAPSVTTSPIAAVTVATAAGKNLVPLEQAWEYVKRHVGNADAEKVVALILLDSVASVHPGETEFYLLKILRVLGRDVDALTSRELVARDPLFEGQEKLRNLVLANLA
jgi:hypothetical protein